MLVARGNRLLELAVRERGAQAGAKVSLQPSVSRRGRDAAVAASSTANRSERVRKEHAGSRSKPLA